MMHFVETHLFTRKVRELLTDDEYQAFQEALIRDPALGPVMPRTGGARKARWGYAGSGKSGGVRILYYLVGEGTVYMLHAFAKNEQANLTHAQEKMLKTFIQGYLA